MNATATKKLRGQVQELGFNLSKGAWRKLKRIYANTPWNERHAFGIKDACDQISTIYARRSAKQARDACDQISTMKPALYRKLMKAVKKAKANL